MFKLVKNEIYKLFHKKSVYITLIVLTLFVLLTNIIYKNYSNYDEVYYDTTTSSEDYVNSLKKEIDSFDLKHGSKDKYVELLISYDYEVYRQENHEEWQYDKYNDYITPIVSEYYSSLYIDEDLETAEIYKQKVADELAKLNNKDWQYFVNLDLVRLNESISYTTDKKSLEIYKYQKYLLEYRLENNISYEKSYLNTAIESLESLIYDKVGYENAKNEQEKKNYKQGYASFFENEYILKNKADTNNEGNLRSVFVNFYSEYLFLILVFVIMIAGGIVSDEFNKGTIKSLLTLPYDRKQILLAKLITSLLMIPFITIFLVLLQMIIGGLFFGFSSLNVPVVAYNFKISGLEVMNLFKYFSLNFLGLLPMIVLLTTLAFSLSTILCSTSFAITITFFGFIGSSLINNFALYKKIEFLDYFVTTNWDLTCFMFGGTSEFNIPMGRSIIICLIYFLIMVAISLIVFKKKNIKNI